MNLQEAKGLAQGQTIYHRSARNADKSPLRARVTSVKTWKTRPEEVEVRLVHGLRNYFRIDQRYLGEWAISEEEAAKGYDEDPAS